MIISNQSMLIHHYVWSNLANFIIQTCLLLHHIQICGLSHAAANSYWILQVEWLPKSRAVIGISKRVPILCWIVLVKPPQLDSFTMLYIACISHFISQLKPHNSPDLSRLTVHILLVALMALGGLYEESFAWIPGCCIGWLRIGWSRSWSLWVSDMTGLNCVIEKMKSISVVEVEVPSDVLSEVSWNPYRPPKHGLCTSDVTKELLLPAFCWPWKARSSDNYCGYVLLFACLNGSQWAIVVFLFHGEPRICMSPTFVWACSGLRHSYWSNFPGSSRVVSSKFCWWIPSRHLA